MVKLSSTLLHGASVGCCYYLIQGCWCRLIVGTDCNLNRSDIFDTYNIWIDGCVVVEVVRCRSQIGFGLIANATDNNRSVLMGDVLLNRFFAIIRIDCNLILRYITRIINLTNDCGLLQLLFIGCWRRFVASSNGLFVSCCWVDLSERILKGFYNWIIHR